MYQGVQEFVYLPWGPGVGSRSSTMYQGVHEFLYVPGVQEFLYVPGMSKSSSIYQGSPGVPWSGVEKHLDDRANYCLDCSFLP